MDRIARSKMPRSTWILLFLAIGPGCATMGDRGKPLVPTDYKIRTGPYQVCTNTKIDADAPVIRQLQHLEAQVQETLGIRVDAGETPVQVYILDDRKALSTSFSSTIPTSPSAGRFFLANGPQRVVYTFFGDRLEEDIRHEATHALLHLAVGDIPLWLDEGLAEYFEGPTDRKGVNPSTSRGSRPTSPPAGRPTWAGWRPSNPSARCRPRLPGVLGLGPLPAQRLSEQQGCPPVLPGRPPVLARGEAALESARGFHPSGLMLAHLDRVRQTPVAVNAPRDPTVRLQSAVTTEPALAPSSVKRRSLMSRFFGMFGS